MKGWIMTLISLSMLLTGNSGTNSPPCRVVTEITVEAPNRSYAYSDPETLHTILNYLRCLVPLEDAAPPELPAVTCQIHLHTSDGRMGSWALYDWQYLQDAQGCWHRIDPDRALFLPVLLEALQV